jgi:hypothetical protein
MAVTGRQSKKEVDDMLDSASGSGGFKPNLTSNTSLEKEKQVPEKKIVKTLVFYADFTFDVFLPNER